MLQNYYQLELALSLQQQISGELGINLNEEFIYLLLEAYRNDCLEEMIRILSMVINRDIKQFTQLMKKFKYTKFLRQIFGQDYDYEKLQRQSDPTYYLEIMNKFLDNRKNINLRYEESVKIFNAVYEVYVIMREKIPQIIKGQIATNNRIRYSLNKRQNNSSPPSQRVRLCYLAVYTHNLCIKKDNPKEPYFIFKGKYVNYDENDDFFLQEKLDNHEFFIVTNENSSQKIYYCQTPLVIDFTEQEVSDPSYYTTDQFEQLKEYVMIKVGQLQFPFTLPQILYFNLQNRINNQINKYVPLNEVRGQLSNDEKNNILTIYAHQSNNQKLQEVNFIKKEQDVINILTYIERMQEQKEKDPYENEYIDPEYKCKFIFEDGLQIKKYLLPNEYDSIQIENYPEDELTLFQQFHLNHESIISIRKQNKSTFVKCLNSSLAEQFYNHIMSQHLVFDNENRIVVKPLITENLHTNKCEFVINVKYTSQLTAEQDKDIIQSIIDTAAKGEYKIQLGNILEQNSLEKICYLQFDKKERAEFIKDTYQDQQTNQIKFKSMSIQEVKQGKITLDFKVYLYYEQLLKQIKQQDYKLFLPKDTTYEGTEKTTGLIQIKVEKVKKEIIRLFDSPQDSNRVNLIIQADTEKQIFKGLCDIQMCIKPKYIHQLKDAYQHHIFIEEQGRVQLKEYSLAYKVYIHYNSQFNRLEFYSYSTAKQTKPKVENLLKELEQFLNSYQIKVSYNISEQDSKLLIEYLRQKGYPIQQSANKVITKIKYSEIKEQNNHIIDTFMKPLHKNMEDCQVCYDTQELFTLSNCKCKTICKSCLKEHIKDCVISSLTEYKDIIKCPSCQTSPISIRDFSKIFDTFGLNDLFKMRFKSGIDQLKNENNQKVFKGCEFPDCKGIMKIPYYISQNMKKNWQCPMCQYDYCIKHIINQKYDLPLHDIHDDGYTCEAQIKDLGVNDLVELGLVKQCPNCKAKFSHEDGCNHLTCKQCECHFCAICDFYEMKKEKIYTHLQQVHQGYSVQKAKFMKGIDKQTEELINKKLEKKNQLINQGKNANADSDDEERIFEKLQLKQQNSLPFQQYDENIWKVFSIEVDEESQLEISKILFEN